MAPHFEGVTACMQQKLRTQLLFENSHPIVQEDLQRLQQIRSGNSVEFDLDWTSEPEETKPRWLKQHWAMMQELKASLGWKKYVVSVCKLAGWIQFLYPEGTSSAADVLDRKPCSGSFTTSPACPGHFQYSWGLWPEVYQHKPEHSSNDIRTWGFGALYNSKRGILVNAAQKVCDRPGLKLNGLQTTCFQTKWFEKSICMCRPWTHSGIEKLLCQGFPVHQLKLAHLTNADSSLEI